MQLIPSNSQLALGIKFGLNMVAPPLVFYSKSKGTARDDLSMKFTAFVVVNVTSDVKTLLTLYHTLVRRSFGNRLK